MLVFLSLFFYMCVSGIFLFVYVLFGFATGVNSMPCPIKIVSVGYCYMDSGSVSQNVRLVTREFAESSQQIFASTENR